MTDKPKRTGNYKGGTPGRTRVNPKPPTSIFYKRVDKALLEKALQKYPDLGDKFIEWLKTLINN